MENVHDGVYGYVSSTLMSLTVHQAGVDHKAADALSRLCAMARRRLTYMTTFLHERSEHTREGQRNISRAGLQYDEESQLIMSTSDIDPVKTREAIVRTVLPKKDQKKGGTVATMEEYKVKRTNNASCRDATTQVRMSGLEFHVYYNGLLVQASKSKTSLEIVVPVLPREQVLHSEHYAPITGHSGELRINKKMQKPFLEPTGPTGLTWRLAYITR